MKFLERLFSGKEREEKGRIELQTPKGTLQINPEDLFEKDPDARIEEFWVDAMDVSEDGYWLLVGRRYGIVQLYDWSGKLHRLPSRPPAQVITNVLFRGKYLGLITPPYLVVYLMEDPRNPQSWKSFRTTQEGIRASVGLDIKGNLLAYGVVGERVYVIDISGGFASQGLDFKSVFSYSESRIGELRTLRFLGQNKLTLSGTDGVALYDMGGRLLGKVDKPSGKAVALHKEGIIVADGTNLLMYDYDLKEELGRVETPINIAHMDLSPDEDLLFLADAERNLLSVVYLPNWQVLKTLEGFGYSIVRVSPDGTIYTCTYTDTEDKRLYSLRALTTNLSNFLYQEERQRQMVKRARESLNSLKVKLKRSALDQNPEDMEDYKRLLSMDMPLREVREVIRQARDLVEEYKFEAFLAQMRGRMAEGTLQGEHLKEVESRMKTEREGRLSKLETLRSEMEGYFKELLEKHLRAVREAIERVEDMDMLDLEALPEVKSAREAFHKLPAAMSSEAQSLLTKSLQERVIRDRLKKSRIVLEEDRVIFGKEDFPRFSGERRRLRWRIKVEDKFLMDGEPYVRVAFEREDGVLLEPKRHSNLLPESALKHLPKWVRSYLRHLNGLFAYEPYRLPHFVAYEETPWFVHNLERFVRFVKEQLLYSEGILILEGDAGVGKNFLVEVFSALTNRPLYIIPCNSKMEKEDITFIYEFEPRRGTRRVYSDLVKALQTPGAVIYFDEINTLPPSLIKIFNPLFDYRRYLTLPTGEVIKPHRDVVFLGGMNPQNYLGVSELPQDVKSRADILYIDYPPFEDGKGMYYPDEAIILKDYVRELSSLSLEEFVYLWYGIVNGVGSVRDREVYEAHIWKLFELLKLANTIRKAYRAYQMQQSEEPVDFVFSIRDTIRCARRLSRYESVKALVLDTVLTKVSSPLEKEIIKSLVEKA